MSNTVKKENHGEQQALAQLQSIKSMVAALEAAGDDDNAREEAETAIQEDALSVEVRSEWYTVGSKVAGGQFKILLCTGGPAVQIIGELNEYGEPESAKLQYQDWFTPWTDLNVRSGEDDFEEVLLTYCRQFYFAE